MLVECKDSATGLKNTGSREECLEGVTVRHALSLPDYSFATVTAEKTLATWTAAVAAKEVFPLYEAEELASANTEDTIFEGRSRDYVTKQGKKKTTFTVFLGFCSYSALKSYDKKLMKIYEFTEDGAILGVQNANLTLGGQDVILNVGPRIPATADRPASAVVTVNYIDRNQLEDRGTKLYPETWNPATDIFGIFDVVLEQVSASATVVKFTASEGCAGGGELLKSLLSAEVEMRLADGTLKTATFTAADANGVMTLTGTGFVSGNTISLVGVVTKSNVSYESPVKLVIVVT